MRFISLKPGKLTSFDKVIQIGCGPNFVLNRQNAFKMMIQEQGIIFWFRFWLLFCYTPEYDDLKMIQENWPLSRHCANILVHDQFLRGSVEDAIKYCLDTALQCMRSSDIDEEETKSRKKTPKQVYKQVLQECTDMAFGSALCLIFYKWLFASKITSSDTVYWSVPKEYLYSNFEPSILEEHMAREWDDNLLTLFGIHLNEVPWLLELLIGGDVSVDESVLVASAYPKNMWQVVHSMKLKRDSWRAKLQSVDELPKYCYVEKKFHQYQVIQKKEKEKEKSPAVNASRCCFCKAADDNFKLKVCKRCETEKWKKTRAYCSKLCQMEHWFQSHCKEHCEFNGNYAVSKTDNAGKTNKTQHPNE